MFRLNIFYSLDHLTHFLCWQYKTSKEVWTQNAIDELTDNYIFIILAWCNHYLFFIKVMEVIFRVF